MVLALAEVKGWKATYGSQEMAVHRTEEYLTIEQLCARIGYKEQTIRNLMSIGELKQGVHFFKPRRRVLFAWTAMEQWVREQDAGPETIEPFYPVHHARSRKAR